MSRLGRGEDNYEALKLRTAVAVNSATGNVSPLAGPGITIDGPFVGLSGNTILLYDSGGAVVREFAATGAGLIAALAAATSGDVVWLPAGTITGDCTVPAGVEVVGLGRERTIIAGQVTGGAGAGLSHLSVANNGADADDIKAIVGPTSGEFSLYDCAVTANNSTGSGYALYSRSVGKIVHRLCVLSAQSGGVDSNPFYVSEDSWSIGAEQGTGAITVTAENGVTISGLTIGLWYALEVTGGPWTDGGGHSWYLFDLSNSGTGGFLGPISTADAYFPPWCAHKENVDANHARVYFQATTTSILIRVSDLPGYFGDNGGSIGYKLSLAIATHGTVDGYASVIENADGRLANVPDGGDRAAWDALNYATLHANDTDTASGIHHTLGTAASQAAAGNHTHPPYVHPNHSGDVTSVGDGAQTIAAKAVTLAKMADMATASLFYRRTAGDGAPEVNSLATLKTDLGTMPTAAHTHNADTIIIPNGVGTPTYDDLQDWLRMTRSAGRLSPNSGVVSAHAGPNGTVDVSEMEGMIFTTNALGGDYIFFKQPAASGIALTDLAVNWIYFDWNGGTPQYAATTNRATIHEYDQFTVGRVFRNGNSVEIQATGHSLYDKDRRSHNRLILKYGNMDHVSGATLSAHATPLRIQTDAGSWYVANTPFTTAAKDTFEVWYKSGSATWVESASMTLFSDIFNGAAAKTYESYQNGNSLGSLGANKYGVFWVFICPEGNLYVLLGTAAYASIGAAQAASVPSSLPAYLSSGWGRLIGRIICQNGAAAFYSVETVFATAFTLSAATDHESLANLNSANYTHLTATQATDLTGGGSTTLHSHASSGSGGAPSIATASATSTDAHTTQNTWEDVNSMSVSATPAGTAKLLCFFTAQVAPNSANWEHFGFRFVLDGSTYSNAYYRTRNANPEGSGAWYPSYPFDMHATFEGVSAAEHTVKVQWHDNNSDLNVVIGERQLTVLIGQ